MQHLKDEVAQWFLSNGTRLLKEDFNRVNPKTEEELTAWYQNTPFYIPDLANWHLYAPYVQKWISYCMSTSGNKVLDYGGGIGSYSIALAESGKTVDYHDLPSLTRDFAVYRFQKRKLPINFTPTLEGKELYDTILAIDVLEHLPHVEDHIARLVSLLKPKGTFIVHAVFTKSEEIPMHLYDPTEKNLTTLLENAGCTLKENVIDGITTFIKI